MLHRKCFNVPLGVLNVLTFPASLRRLMFKHSSRPISLSGVVSGWYSSRPVGPHLSSRVAATGQPVTILSGQMNNLRESQAFDRNLRAVSSRSSSMGCTNWSRLRSQFSRCWTFKPANLGWVHANSFHMWPCSVLACENSILPRCSRD